MRIYECYKYKNGYYISLFVSALIGGIVAYFVEGDIDIYMFIILYEIVLYTSGKIEKILYIVDILIIMSVIILRQVSSFKDVI